MQLCLKNQAGQEALVFVLFKPPVRNRSRKDGTKKRRYLNQTQRHITAHTPHLQSLILSSKAVIKVNRLTTRFT